MVVVNIVDLFSNGIVWSKDFGASYGQLIRQVTAFSLHRLVGISDKASKRYTIEFMNAKPCSPNCNTCGNDASIFGCSTCKPGFVMQGDGRCICLDGQFSDGSSCLACHQDCLTCYGPGDTKCIQIAPPPPPLPSITPPPTPAKTNN